MVSPKAGDGKPLAQIAEAGIFIISCRALKFLRLFALGGDRVLPIEATASRRDPYANAGPAPMRNTPSACKIDLRQIYADRASQANPVKH
jgi:hypothetical protein